VKPINLSEYRTWWIVNDTDDRIMVDVQKKLFGLGYYWRGRNFDTIYNPYVGVRIRSIGNLNEDSSHSFGCWINETPSYERDYKVSATQFLKGDYV
jgi:hypothetical protein